MNTYIIVEIASTHEGDFDLAEKLISSASDTEADGIKFQVYNADELAVKSYRWYDTYKKLSFTKEQWGKLIDYATLLGLDVWVDPYDRWGLEIVNTFFEKIKGVKTPSTILSDYELVHDILKLECKKLVGVGGFSIKQIITLFEQLHFYKYNNIILLCGFQKYPTKVEDSNLERISVVKKEFGMKVGYADHVDGGSELAKVMPCLAIMKGAEVIEKHMTINRGAKGLDYYSSLNPDIFRDMVRMIRESEEAIGDGMVNSVEMDYLKDATKIVAKQDISSGKILTKNNIHFRRTDDVGLLPYQYSELVGRIATSDIVTDRCIDLNNTRKPKICVLIAVRMKSKRLPNKALLELEGYTAIERMVNNLKPSKYIDEVILATSTNEEDTPIVELAKEKGINYFRGDEDNVISRFLGAAKQFNADIVIRATGDCPLVSYEVVDYLVEEHLKCGADYTGIEIDDSPVGTFVEVITYDALDKFSKQDIDLNYSEYMTWYFRNNSQFFTVNICPVPPEYISTHRLTLDYQEDLELIRKIYKDLGKGNGAIPLSKTISYLDENPEIANINKNATLRWKTDKKLIEKLNRVTKIKENKK